MKKFKEFENLIKIYAELISSYESNQFEIEKNSRNLKKNSVIYNSFKNSSSFNNLLIDLVESFRIVKENELNTNTYRVCTEGDYFEIEYITVYSGKNPRWFFVGASNCKG